MAEWFDYCLVAIVVIVALTAIGTRLKAKFDEVNKTLK